MQRLGFMFKYIIFQLACNEWVGYLHTNVGQGNGGICT